MLSTIDWLRREIELKTQIALLKKQIKQLEWDAAMYQCLCAMFNGDLEEVLLALAQVEKPKDLGD